MIGKWGFSLLPFYLGIIPIFANNNYTLTIRNYGGEMGQPGSPGMAPEGALPLGRGAAVHKSAKNAL